MCNWMLSMSRDHRCGLSHPKTVRSSTRAVVPRSSTRTMTGVHGLWWTPETAIRTPSASATHVLNGRRRRRSVVSLPSRRRRRRSIVSPPSRRRRRWRRPEWRRYRPAIPRRSATRCTAPQRISLSISPLIAALKPQSNGPSYSNTVIGTLAVDGGLLHLV